MAGVKVRSDFTCQRAVRVVAIPYYTAPPTPGQGRKLAVLDGRLRDRIESLRADQEDIS